MTADLWETYIVQIDIDTSIMCQDKVPNRVGPLDRMCVVVEGVQKPRILGSNELA